MWYRGMYPGSFRLVLFCQTTFLAHACRIDRYGVSRIFYIKKLYLRHLDGFDLNFMIWRYRRFNFLFNVFKSYGRGLLQIQKMNFDSPVMSKINLLFMLIMLIYDMIWVLLYLTNATMIILGEIVHESSCTGVSIKSRGWFYEYFHFKTQKTQQSDGFRAFRCSFYVVNQTIVSHLVLQILMIENQTFSLDRFIHSSCRTSWSMVTIKFFVRILQVHEFNKYAGQICAQKGQPW